MRKYEIKKLKKYRGHEGEPLFQGELYCDGKKVAFIGDGDWGGPMVIDFFGNKEDETACIEWSKTQPSDFDNIGPRTYEDKRTQKQKDYARFEFVLGDLLNQELKIKEAKSLKNKKRPVMFVVKGKNCIRQSSVPNGTDPQEVRDYFQNKYGEDITFLSDMTIEQIIEVM